MRIRILLFVLLALLVGVATFAVYAFATYDDPTVDPAWMVEPSSDGPDGAVTVRYTGTSTLMFSDGETQWMVDGWFSRFGPLELVRDSIAPDLDAIARGLANNGVERLAVVIPVHSHYDHAMDAPEVARRTGAILLGSPSTANIARGWGLDESQIRIAIGREPISFGRFEITLIPTRHFQFPDPATREALLSDRKITEPLVPPVPASAYRVGQPYAIHVVHPRGRFLVQGSAGYIEGGLAGFDAEVVFLGIGGLDGQTQAYRDAYWRETVTTIGAKRVIPIHWDSLTAPAEGPFRGQVRAARLLLGHGGEVDLVDELNRWTAADPELSISTLPRFEEIVLF